MVLTGLRNHRPDMPRSLAGSHMENAAMDEKGHAGRPRKAERTTREKGQARL